MKNSKIVDVFKDGNIVVPMYFFKNYTELGLELDEFMVLMYLYNSGNNFLFDPNKIKNDLNMNFGEVMNYISILTDKGFIQVDVLKNDKDVMEEVVILDNFYHKLSLLVMDQVNEKVNDKDNSNIFSMIESEFGRTLSPLEYDIINGWSDRNISEELIKEALKEAAYSGVSNLRYIDKILFEWEKNNIKSIEDVEKRRRDRRNKNGKNQDSEIDMDIVDWNWFDEDE